MAGVVCMVQQRPCVIKRPGQGGEGLPPPCPLVSATCAAATQVPRPEFDKGSQLLVAELHPLVVAVEVERARPRRFLRERAVSEPGRERAHE